MANFTFITSVTFDGQGWLVKANWSAGNCVERTKMFCGTRVMYPSMTIRRSPVLKCQLAIDIQVRSTLGRFPFSCSCSSSCAAAGKVERRSAAVIAVETLRMWISRSCEVSEVK